MVQSGKTNHRQSIFCSYSSADRVRVNGLALLLEALGHEVFIDHKTIKPGARWEAKLQEGLNLADMLIIFWTRNSSRSDWVRKEVEYFHTHFPDHPIVPMLGDETPLSELLNSYQHSDFFPLINELLELKRNMEKQGAKPPQIQTMILQRLKEAGIDIKPKDHKKLMGLFVSTGIMGLLAAPGVYLHSLANKATETVAQATWGQAAGLAVAAVSGAVICHTISDTGSSASQLSGKDIAMTSSTDQTQKDISPAGLVSAEQAAVDKWLGTWSGMTEYDNNQQGEIWMKISRDCDLYSVETNTSKANELTLLYLNSEKIKFIDKIGTEVDVSRTGANSASAKVKHPGSIAQLGIQQIMTAVFEKTINSKPKPCPR